MGLIYPSRTFMTTVSLSPSLHTQKWTLGGDPFASRLCLNGSEIALGEAGDTDLAKIASAFGTYLSAPERQTESLSTKLIVAHNAGQIFGKVADHNQKVYDKVLITIFHVILAILTLGIFSLRNQYLIDMPKVDLLPGLDLAKLGDQEKWELRDNLSMREFFLLEETRREELLNNFSTALLRGVSTTFLRWRELPRDAQGAVSLRCDWARRQRVTLTRAPPRAPWIGATSTFLQPRIENFSTRGYQMGL